MNTDKPATEKNKTPSAAGPVLAVFVLAGIFLALLIYTITFYRNEVPSPEERTATLHNWFAARYHTADYYGVYNMTDLYEYEIRDNPDFDKYREVALAFRLFLNVKEYDYEAKALRDDAVARRASDARQALYDMEGNCAFPENEKHIRAIIERTKKEVP